MCLWASGGGGGDDVQSIGAELGLQQPPPLQEEDGDVEGVHIRVGRGSTRHQFPQQHAKRPLQEEHTHT